MNIYTHPAEIKEIANTLYNKAPIAWTISTNFYELDGKIYGWWLEGSGTFPELRNEIPANATLNN